MELIHKNLAEKRWRELSLCEQLANIGSEISRAQIWQNKDRRIFENAITRALELFEFTLSDRRWRGRLREIARSREVFLDAIDGGKEYKSSLSDLNRYFLSFAYCARLKS